MSTATTTAATATAEPDAAAAPPGKRRKVVVLGLVVVLVAAAAAWFLFLRGGDEAEAEHAPEPGEVLTLDPITMNLADGRLLKVGIALQLPLAEGGGHGGEVSGAMALDEAIAYLGSKSYPELVTPEGRATAKEELSVRVAKRYHDHVMEVYFTDFLMQ